MPCLAKTQSVAPGDHFEQNRHETPFLRVLGASIFLKFFSHLASISTQGGVEATNLGKTLRGNGILEQLRSPHPPRGRRCRMSSPFRILSLDLGVIHDSHQP